MQTRGLDGSRLEVGTGADVAGAYELRRAFVALGWQTKFGSRPHLALGNRGLHIEVVGQVVRKIGAS